MLAETLRKSLELGSTRDDIRFDYRRGYIQFPKNESVLPGHVFHAQSLAEKYGVSHALRDSGVAILRSPFHDASLARVYAVESTSSFSSNSWQSYFHSMLESLYEPEPSIVEMLNHRESAERFAEIQFRKVLLSSSIDIDFPFRPSLRPFGRYSQIFVLKLIVGVAPWPKKWIRCHVFKCISVFPSLLQMVVRFWVANGFINARPISLVTLPVIVLVWLPKAFVRESSILLILMIFIALLCTKILFGAS